MKIWDTWLFNGELEALHTRLAIPGIDKRVVVEALMTHSGQKKDKLFYQWDLPGVILVTPDLSQFQGPWERENGQRNAIMQGLVDARDDDVVMISDCDEVPSPDGISRAVQELSKHPAVVLRQRMYNYSREFEDLRGWRGTVVTSYRHLQFHTPQELRDQRENLPQIHDAGEHLSYFGGAEEVARKLASFAHTEYSGLATDTATIEDRMRKGEDMFGRWMLDSHTEPVLRQSGHHASEHLQASATHVCQDMFRGQLPSVAVHPGK